MGSDIHVTAVILRDQRGRVLLVRKKDTTMWMNPGGKPKADETPAICGAREVREELGLIIEPESMVYLGEFTSDAANEPGCNVVAHVFNWPYPVTVSPTPDAEIAELRWHDPQTGFEDATLSPLYVEQIAPRLGDIG